MLHEVDFLLVEIEGALAESVAHLLDDAACSVLLVDDRLDLGAPSVQTSFEESIDADV